MTAAVAMLLLVGPILALHDDDMPTSTRVVQSAAINTENRTFYTGNLNWWYEAGVSGVLSMRGHDTSANGGTIRQVTVCLHSDSGFQRRFTATASVEQGGETLQSITFAEYYAGNLFSCHNLNNFSAVVAPGPFSVVVTYDKYKLDNLFLGLPATDGGQIFDVQIGNQRPPMGTGSQGPVQMRGVGIRYLIDVNSEPPPPPPPPPPDPETCTESNTQTCITGGRFAVSIDWRAADGSSGAARAELFSSDTAYFWIFDPDNIEATVKVLDACTLNDGFWVFAGGMTDLEMTITIEDTEGGLVRSYTSSLGENFQTVVDTSAFATCP